MTNVTKLHKELIDGAHDLTLQRLYDGPVDTQRQRYADAVKNYCQYFGSHPVSIFSSPGRSEIGGNHTDHQNGCVLAAAIHLDIIAIAGCADDRIHIISEGHGEYRIPLDNLAADSKDCGTTTALIKGILAGFQKAGYHIGGFTAYITSNLPSGIGLSSSAAFTMLLGGILSELYNHGVPSPLEIAKIARFAENVYFGKPCGLMDQLVCGLGGMLHIDFQDETRPVVSPISVDFDSFQYDLCIVHTGGSHANLIEEYAAIPKEMSQVAKVLGFKTLRPVTLHMLTKASTRIRKQCGDRAFLRALHFVLENRRVSQQADCLRCNDFFGFLNLVEQSGTSSYKFLQNIYPPSSSSHQDIALALGVSENLLGSDGVCRVHGGGFAGTIQTWVKQENTEEYKHIMDEMFGSDACRKLSIRQHGMAKVI